MRNWAGNYEFRAESVLEPTSIDELCRVIADSSRIRVLGSRHSFTDIADSDAIIDMRRLPERFVVAADRLSVTVDGGMTYGRLAVLLREEGLALSNLASLPHISIAGAIATGTHGSGNDNRNLASQVSAIELATATTDLVAFRRRDPEFDGAVVSLGALGVVTSITLEVEPSFDVSQHVYDHLLHETFQENFDAIVGAGYSVSSFTRWDGVIEQVWVKGRVGLDADPGDALFGASPATENRHPIRGNDGAACTPQLGVPGPWSERLPHFKLEFNPSAGNEIQSEFFVERSHAAGAIDALRDIGDRLDDALLVSEVRTVAGDDLWLSPLQGRDSVAFHFTWGANAELAQLAAALVGRVLAEFDARTHWGKVFEPDDANLDSYPRLADFLALVSRLDPRRAFRNAWFDRIFG